MAEPARIAVELFHGDAMGWPARPDVAHFHVVAG
jgi:hypothetical protein